MSTDLPPGANVAALRKERRWSQARLARKTNVSASTISKIEIGDRTLTPATAAAIGKAMGLTMDEVLGRASITPSAEQQLTALRAELRDYDLPHKQEIRSGQVEAALTTAGVFRDEVEVAKLLAMLPKLIRDATSYAHRVNTPDAWMALAESYSTAYWLAARHRWMDLAELAVTRQRWAAEQKPNPLARAIAARDRAGTYLNFGDIERGLLIVDRAVADAQNHLSGEERDIAVCLLNLRGMTLAGRLEDNRAALSEAQRHIDSAHATSLGIEHDIDVHGLTVGPRNTFTHELATNVDLGRPRHALELTDNLTRDLRGLPPTRVAPTHINMARAYLDVGDRDSALESLGKAFEAAPQFARIHAMGREVFRVVSSLHKRSNARILKLSKVSGIPL
ncbi:helix-turn-helix domain-containing protein [Streptomyces silvensis]|uniref:helix-turn-helix domain-containing protein n=1 Tax=Streptomyces silvensis TaxID=1765722 RepID=UPI00099E70D2|nr:helix-turn-helix transcriptional regulator [Streptomyces silvensis]